MVSFRAGAVKQWPSDGIPDVATADEATGAPHPCSIYARLRHAESQLTMFQSLRGIQRNARRTSIHQGGEGEGWVLLLRVNRSSYVSWPMRRPEASTYQDTHGCHYAGVNDDIICHHHQHQGE